MRATSGESTDTENSVAEIVKLQLIAVGKLREAYFKAACDEYAGRIRHFLPLDESEVPSATSDSGNGTGKGALQAEADAILKQIPQGSKLIALDIRGKQFSSEKCLNILQDEMLASTNPLDLRDWRGLGAFPSVIGFSRSAAEFLPHDLSSRTCPGNAV